MAFGVHNDFMQRSVCHAIICNVCLNILDGTLEAQKPTTSGVNFCLKNILNLCDKKFLVKTCTNIEEIYYLLKELLHDNNLKAFDQYILIDDAVQ